VPSFALVAPIRLSISECGQFVLFRKSNLTANQSVIRDVHHVPAIQDGAASQLAPRRLHLPPISSLLPPILSRFLLLLHLEALELKVSPVACFCRRCCALALMAISYSGVLDLDLMLIWQFQADQLRQAPEITVGPRGR
jgi:hypothetical protein